MKQLLGAYRLGGPRKTSAARTPQSDSPAADRQKIENNQVGLDPETIYEIRKLHYQTKRLADQGITGCYRSAFRGRGIEFEEVRDYSPGDEIRSIDWKVTARTGRPYVKSYREERELTVLIAVDVSSSTLTGTKGLLREALIAKVGAVLTMIALNNNDKVGLVAFSNKIELYHPPRKARSAVWRILHEVMMPRAYHPHTDLASLFSFISSVLKRRAIIFVVSDFFSPPFERQLATAAKRHDITAITVSDPADWQLPRVGIVRLQNPESGMLTTIDCSDPAVLSHYAQSAEQADCQLQALLNRHGVGRIALRTDRPFIGEIRKFLLTRKLRPPRLRN